MEEERTRIELMGGEIRSKTHSDGWKETRIFLKGEDIWTYQAVTDFGVIATPEVVKTELDLRRKVFLVVASDGVWEFLDSEHVVNTIADSIEDGPAKLAKLQLEATNQNQDNFSVTHFKSGYTLVCVFDGHGKLGHKVSTRAVQTVPYFLVSESGFGQEHVPESGIEEALKNAFEEAHNDVIACLRTDPKGQTSGTTAVAALFKGNKAKNWARKL
eukprot:s682_g24.t1